MKYDKGKGSALQIVDCQLQSTEQPSACFTENDQTKSCQAVPSTGMRLMQTEGRTNAHPHLHSNLHSNLYLCLHLVGFRTDLEIRNWVNMNKGD